MGFNRYTLGLVYETCEGKCFYCGMPQKPFGDWEVDHLHPRAQGGSDTLLNLALACKRCNRAKGNRTVEEYKDYLRDRIATHLNCALEVCYYLTPSETSDEMKFVTHGIEESIGPSLQIQITFPGEKHRAEISESLSSERPELKDETDSIQ